jgi:menaquinone-dependent protoporphyrinogen oxidase
MAKILLIYSTTDGHTHKICIRLKSLVENQNNSATLLPVEQADSIDIKLFDKIVLGASIRYGKHGPQVYEFVRKNAKLLETKPNAFFSVNLVARKPGKQQPQTNPYLKKFLKKTPWKPKQLAVFAGKIDYAKYRFWDRLMIRLIMFATQGPTDPKSCIEFTDWNQVKKFANVLNQM